jgi:hypothetical protein
MACTRCGSLMLREPAAIHCVSCGERVEVIDADDDARLRQRLLDWIWRPKSAECREEFREIVAAPPRPGRGWVTLPGPGRQNCRAASRRAPSSRRERGVVSGLGAGENRKATRMIAAILRRYLEGGA